MTTQTLQFPGNTFRLHFLALWRGALRFGRRRPKRLRLCESLPLGDRRFVAVVEFDAARFLVGGTPSSLVLLSRLADVGAQKEGETEAPGKRRDAC
jgi:flagellar biogenesis protein FliO